MDQETIARAVTTVAIRREQVEDNARDWRFLLVLIDADGQDVFLLDLEPLASQTHQGIGEIDDEPRRTVEHLHFGNDRTPTSEDLDGRDTAFVHDANAADYRRRAERLRHDAGLQ